MRIAFYAPLKSPDDPTPSGDRRMARLLMRALREAGHDVALASDFRSYDGRGDDSRQAALQAEAGAIAETLLAGWRQNGAAIAPELWFTYHLYHKAPDWLGPAVCAELAIPYVVAEASHAPKQSGGAWDRGYRAAAAAIASAAVVYAMTRLDSACLEPLVQPPHRLCYLPPFIDAMPVSAAESADIEHRFGIDMTRHRLLTVAMMRPGDKLASYRELAQALALLEGDDWQLTIVGDGPCRPEVERLFATFGDRVRLIGALAEEALNAVYAAADLYLWPGVGEAYGMAFLEAQAQATPVVATTRRGIPDVVRADAGGLLVPPADPAAFAAAIRRLLDDAPLRRRMAGAAQVFVTRERSLAATAAQLRASLP